MKELNRKNSLIIVSIFTLIQLPAFFLSKFSFNSLPYDDASSYQIFVADVLRGKLNFSLGSFQGAALPAIPFYWFFRTPQAYSFINFIFAVATIPLMYIFAKKIFRSELLGVLAALFYALIPAIIFSPFSGYPQGVFHFLTILTTILVLHRSPWSFLIFGWSLITKPFSIVLLPFFIATKQIKQFLLGSLIGLFYLEIVFLSTGKIQLGVHQNITPANVFHFDHLIYNLASTPPLILSIHNFLPFSKTTTLADMSHISPLIIVFSIIVLLNFRRYFKNFRPFTILASFSLLALTLPLTLSYTDTNYLQTFYLAAILLSLPFIKEHPLVLPVTVALTGYQYFYFFLRYQEFWPGNSSLYLFLIEFTGLVITLWLTRENIRLYFRQLHVAAMSK